MTSSNPLLSYVDPSTDPLVAAIATARDRYYAAAEAQATARRESARRVRATPLPSASATSRALASDYNDKCDEATRVARELASLRRSLEATGEVEFTNLGAPTTDADADADAASDALIVAVQMAVDAGWPKDVLGRYFGGERNPNWARRVLARKRNATPPAATTDPSTPEF